MIIDTTTTTSFAEKILTLICDVTTRFKTCLPTTREYKHSVSTDSRDQWQCGLMSVYSQIKPKTGYTSAVPTSPTCKMKCIYLSVQSFFLNEYIH